MGKNLRQIELVIYACLINGVAFYLQPLPNGVLTTRVLTSGLTGLSFLVTSLLIFSLMVFILVCLFKTTSLNVPDCRSTFYFFLRAFMPALGVRLLFDGVNLLIIQLLPSYAELFLLFTEAVYIWLLFFVVGVVLRCEKQRSGPRRRAALIGGVLLLTVTAVWYVLRFFIDYRARTHGAAKYVAYNLTNEASTHSFRLQLLLLVFSMLLWSVLFFRYAFFSVERNQRPEYPRYGSIFMARILVIFLGVPFLIMGKIMALPQGAINHIKTPTTTVTHMSGERHFSTNSKSRMITRKVSYAQEEAVFNETKVMVLYGNDHLLTFIPEMRRDELRKETPIPEEETHTAKAYRYGFDAVAYFSSGKPVAMNFRKINSYPKKDDTLILIMEQLIQEGYFEAFEYSYQYLLKYDKTFIHPYIKKYAKGELTAEEQEKNNYLKPDYITDYAKNIDV